jgi:hypothetical protein
VPSPIAQTAADNWFPDPDFDGRRVHVLEYDRPASGDDEALTRQSIALMYRLANRDAYSPAVRAAVIEAVQGLDSNSTALQITDAVFAFCKAKVTYEHEADMQTPFADFGRFLYDQTLIAPAALLAMPRPSGDCVDFSMLALAMCRLCNIPAGFKTIAADPRSPAYSHVYVVAQIAPGRFYPLDTSNGPGPGFEFDLPAGKKAKFWPNPQDTRKPAAMIHTRRPRRFSRLGSLIDDSGQSDPSGSSGGTDPANDPGYNVTQPGDPASNSTPSAWSKIATLIVNDATSIAAPLIRQNSIQAPYYITGADGAQILYDPSTGRTANAGSAYQRTPAIVSQNLLIGAGIAAAALFAFSAFRK